MDRPPPITTEMVSESNEKRATINTVPVVTLIHATPKIIVSLPVLVGPVATATMLPPVRFPPPASGMWPSRTTIIRSTIRMVVAVEEVLALVVAIMAIPTTTIITIITRATTTMAPKRWEQVVAAVAVDLVRLDRIS